MRRKAKTDVRFDPEIAVFPGTYITATTTLTLKIHNDMKRALKFRWSKYSSQEEEQEILSGVDLYDPEIRQKYGKMLDFTSDHFVIEQITGEIWAERFQYFTFYFTPHGVDDFEEKAYLLDTETGKRYCLTLKGKGLPPEARFSVDTINVGHVSLDAVCEYTIILSNDGAVDIDYDVDCGSKNGLFVKFVPNRGHVPIGESLQIKVDFVASSVGPFNEKFPFNIKGATNFKPTITLFGKVFGPEFVVSPKFLNYRDLSYGFLYVQEFEIENKSDIPFDFAVRPIQDNTFSPREFNIIPAEGTIEKFGKQTVQVEFVPISVQKYEVKLAIDVLKVGEALEFVTLTANCLQPSLRLLSSTVDFGRVFIGKQYTKDITIVDDSDFPAKFEFVLPPDSAVAQALISVPRLRGVVNRQQQLPMKLSILPQILGPIKMTAHVRAYGSESPLIPFTIEALCVGPNILLSTQSINFGNVRVLSHANNKVVMKNDSLIPAIFSASIQSDTGVFSVEPEQGKINPGDSCQLTVTASIDDTISFTGKVAIHFQNLNPIYVDLAAKGQGSPIVSSIPMNAIDFDYILNQQKAVKTFTVTNHGRRAQELRWSQLKSKTEDNASPPFTVEIKPEQVVIEPRTSVDFQLSAFSETPCSFSTILQCHATLGRSRSDLWKTTVKGEVIKPVLSFSTNFIEFVHRHDPEKEEALASKLSKPSAQLMPSQSKPLRVKNLAKLPLDVNVEVSQPFSVSPAVFTLSPGEEFDLDVTFNASFKEDFCTEVLNRRLVFTFKDHPQKLYVNLRGSFIFPNLSFSESMNMNFGNLMINTEQTKEVKMTVSSDMDVEWKWQLLSDDPACDVGRIFDVFPIRGKLEKGQSDEVHFSFFAIAGEDGTSKTYSATAICHVIGGPDYVVNLSGGAAAINYQVTPTEIDFGSKMYDERVSKSVKVRNMSDVPITYTVKIPKSSKFSHLLVSPIEGTIPVGENAKLSVTVIGGIPQDFTEYFVLQIGQFEEKKVSVHLNCHFPQITLNLPRDATDPATQARGDGESHSDVEKKLIVERLHARHVIPSTKTTGRAKKKENKNQFNGFVMAEYSLETGPITLGDVKEFNFELTSCAPFPISFELVGNVLRGTGFTVEPAAAESIPPGSSLPMKVIFDTTQRMLNTDGVLQWDLVFRLTNDFGFLVRLKTEMVLPTLALSKKRFEFGEVIVGQRKVLTLQLQNMNTVPCEYNFDNIIVQSQPPKPSKNATEEPKIFDVVPSNAVIRPGSFQNVEISFSPVSNGEYLMELPLLIKYNLESKAIQLSGEGVQMKVIFDPPIANCPPILPFSDPSELEVKMINPSNYPIEVFSYQFDFDLFCSNFRRKIGTSSNENVVFSQEGGPYSACVIVHGPSMSGCTTVSNFVSKTLGGIPVLKLKEIWKELLEGEGASAADYTAKFFERITQPDCAAGFVIDSLNVFTDGKDADQFVLSCIKAKNCYEETVKNPFNAIPHQNLLSCELALNYLLQALEGQFVFFVGVRTTLDLVYSRIEKHKSDELNRKKEEFLNEKNALFNMTEEEYQALSEDEREEIDKRRKDFRNRLVNTPDGEEGDGRGSRRNVRRKKDERGETRAKKGDDTPKRRTKLPTDPHDREILLFDFIVGSLAKAVEDGNDNFQVFDPILAKKSLETEITEEEEEQKPKSYLQQKNSILLNHNCTIEELEASVTDFIPNLQMIKEVKFAEMIPSERVENSKTQVTPVSRYQDAPPFFTIANAESQAAMDTSGKDGDTEDETTSDFDVSRLTNRWRIEPNSSQTITILFTAETLGTYKGQLLFGISNCTCDILKLPCIGVCGQPDIDRSSKTIFDKRVAKCEWRTERAFATDKQEFVFGPTLISKEKLAKNQLPPYVEVIHLANPTEFPAKVSMVFGESTCQWVADPATLVIPPGETTDVKIGVNPTVPEMHKTTMTVFVADQPDPFYLNFSCDCCVPALDAPSPVLDFGKLLLKQSRSLQLDFKNPGKLPVFWKLKNTKEVESNITFSATEGLVPPKRGFSLKASFTSQKQVSIKKNINIDIMDKNQTRVYESVTVPITADAFDVLFDFQYPKGLDHLQFGTINVQQSKSLSCTLKNKGKFPLKYKITSIDKLFEVRPSEGTLGPNDKPVALNFTITPSKVLRFKNAKGISMHVTDPITGTTTTVLPIPFSCEALYSQFYVSPGRELDFGPVPITTAVTKQFTITNDGRFPFDFELVGSNTNVPEPVVAPSPNGKKGRAPPAQKGRQSKKGAAGVAVEIGNFTVSPGTGSLHPGSSVTIDASFQSPTPGQNNTPVFIKITDADPSKRDADMSVKLRANNVSPGIVTNRFERIFPNLEMCLRYDVTRQEKTAFLEDEQVLHFEPLILQHKRQVELVLTNTKPVSCIVDLSIKPKAKDRTSVPFDVSEKSVSLEPNSSHTVTITFNPVTCDSFVGLFEGAVRTGVANDKLLKFTVEGIGTLPAVKIVGLDPGKPNSYSTNLGRTLIGFTREKVISLVNEGVIDAHIKMTTKGGGDLEIVDQKAFQNFVVPPQSTTNITILFKPTNSKKNSLDMTLAIADNPKATTQLSVIAEGSSEDVVFEGLASDDGDIFFRDCIVGRQQQSTFLLKNVGAQTCRFTFSQQPNLTLAPRVGHIHPGKSKQITASVFSDHPMKQTVIKVGCQVSKIELQDPEAPDWDDSMKVVKFVEKDSIKVETPQAPEPPKKKRPLPSRKALPPLQSPKETPAEKPAEPEFIRVVEVKEEPANTVIPGKTQDLPMRATVIVDNIRYSMDLNEITFSPTMMCQTRVVDCKMTNTSQIKFEYCWKVSDFESVRTDYWRTRPPPFSVEPTSGFIAPGTSTVFKVKFSPEEVDDFTAVLECSIPFLSQMPPPKIRVAGLSRRPLCHFNVKLSDYLSRRHPDYTTPLPDGVRVIELSSSAVGRKCSHRFEILNPTASPYEVNWKYVGDSPESQIVCETPTGFVSSNRRYTVTFSYTPRSLRPVESLWEFQIPDHSMSVFFLFVGRIVPK